MKNLFLLRKAALNNSLLYLFVFSLSVHKHVRSERRRNFKSILSFDLMLRKQFMYFPRIFRMMERLLCSQEYTAHITITEVIRLSLIGQLPINNSV